MSVAKVPHMFARRVLAAIAITVSLSASVAAFSAAPAKADAVNWGAIAYSNDGSTAGAWNYPSSNSAANAVRSRCGSSCGYFTFYNSCGAVAYSNNGTRVAWARGYQTPAGARGAALRKLGLRGYVARWVCTDR